MGLKDLKSRLDLLGGFQQEGGTLGEMENFSPTKFQKGTDAASQAHIDSLEVVPGGSQNSPFQDLDGEPGPLFDKGKDSMLQQNSLLQVPGGDSNSPYQDYDGEQPPAFQREYDIADQAHISSLAAVPGGDSSSAFQDRGDGATPAQYVNNMPN